MCGGCGKLFEKMIYLDTHVRQQHYETNHFICTVCKKRYSRKENLWSHIAEDHKKSFNCDSCEMTFKSEQELKIHDSKTIKVTMILTNVTIKSSQKFC